MAKTKKNKKTPTTDFSKFFVLAKDTEKKKVLNEVIKKANADQKLLYNTA